MGLYCHILSDMVYLKLLLVLAALYSTATSDVNRRYNVLDFGITKDDFIAFKPDMGPIDEMFTVCAWVKPRLGDTDHRIWFDYVTNTTDDEVMISDNGNYNMVLNQNLGVKSSFNRSIGTWHHQCLAWEYSSATKNIFKNGALIGTETVSRNRLLQMNGTLILGWEMDTNGAFSQQIFGGQLYKMNIFSEFLTTSEIKNIYDAGFCGEEEELYGRHRFLKWEDILLEEKSGNVTEVPSGCLDRDDHEYNKWDILFTAPYYMKDLTSDMIARLSEPQDWSILADFIGSNLTDGFIRHFKRYHDDENHTLEVNSD